MNHFDIRTTLSLYPTAIKSHDIIYIARGATASLNFNFGDKIYGFDNVDQLTFILKQDKSYYEYKMFTYLVPSMDETVVAGKIYYSDVQAIDNDEYACTGHPVLEPAGNPKEQNYYEVVEENHSWRDTKYLVDSHFSQFSGEGYDYISLVLHSAETMQFKPTMIDNHILCEVAIRLNTDMFGNLGGQDSIILEPQHPIAVVDSLYSRIK